MDTPRLLLLAALGVAALAAPEDKVNATEAAPVPGTYYWNSDMALRQHIPKLFEPHGKKPTWHNINYGMVVVIDGYKAGMSIAALASMKDDIHKFNHLNPASAAYYTTAYRWFRRFLDLLPEALKNRSSVSSMHKVWRKRWMYNEVWVPHWMRKVLFFVKDWEKEERERPRFDRYAEPSFGKYQKYPNKWFDNWNSIRIWQSVEGLDRSKASVYPLYG